MKSLWHNLCPGRCKIESFDGYLSDMVIVCEREVGHDGQHQRTINGGEAYVYWVNHDEAKKGTETP